MNSDQLDPVSIRSGEAHAFVSEELEDAVGLAGAANDSAGSWLMNGVLGIR